MACSEQTHSPDANYEASAPDGDSDHPSGVAKRPPGPYPWPHATGSGPGGGGRTCGLRSNKRTARRRDSVDGPCD